MTVYKLNKFEAFTVMLKHCSQAMKNRVKEASNYETDIRNNPFKLLEAIKTKIFGQVRAKYKYNQVTNMLLQFFSTKQEHGESLTVYIKQFKQARDNVKLTLGADQITSQGTMRVSTESFAQVMREQ